ncbi:hypothetical protein [Robinsoniella peoriensis]|nr:hypothetical protein [Robinsoniella peoriensis]
MLYRIGSVAKSRHIELFKLILMELWMHLGVGDGAVTLGSSYISVVDI